MPSFQYSTHLLSIFMMMLAFQITPDHPKGKVVEVPKPQPGGNEALIQVLRAGICNTDMEIMKGYMGFQGTLGHGMCYVCACERG